MNCTKKIFLLYTISVFLVEVLTGCISPAAKTPKCTILFEDNDSLFFSKQVNEVKQGGDLTISIGLPHNERISSINYDYYTLSSKIGESLSYDYYELTLSSIMYSAVIQITTAPSYTTLYYIDETSTPVTVMEESPHLYFNTLPYNEEYTKDGCVAVGWNTSLDGSGDSIGFGSRINHLGEQQTELYLEWLPSNSSDDFTYYLTDNNEIAITAYHGNGNIIIPQYIDGYPVTIIESDAFGDISCEIFILPPTVKTVESGAFASLTVDDFYFFDNILSVFEDSFKDYSITTLHINAATAPVYSRSYFDTFSDKVDYLSSISNQDKIVLFCGSSARFGYDSSMLNTAFPDYNIANMGVYAYSNMIFQAKIIHHFMKQGDILLSSPEFDAIDMQFCGSNAFDRETFCMMESNYDMLTLLDCREFTNIFEAFNEYNTQRQDMEERSYLETASSYDEDGNLQNSSTYNLYGDYILFRENNTEGISFGIKRAFYNPDYFSQKDIDGINAVYDSFAELGVTVFFTYSPRSNISISDDSNEASIKLLDEMLREKLHAPVISSLEASLMNPLYFHGTDNHLSTEGVAVRTALVIKDLQKALED